ncbi:MAG: hypothetical protein CVU19_04945 [Betaproteobacteria bacterium HGW-Betaproteobacteria-13]|jgi:hypothetical protein|uniref:Pyrimidine/purine nucleoside phosphorylase n=1 Tax=Parazoarcus communis TaxID=41977 RepID=A0A2U8H7K4_9RHOO|nr:pyrimidine/purine nucleoside phosphorylase [Parazoarcus communis]AWI81560.1 hypothetical protein CEW87_20700 [Parazoarcus communis]PKO81790.1 MAG: hypothetical protein CVU19_04945 [Betaproteobacteria bacterium HGW-Betaproteobacteria-13]
MSITETLDGVAVSTKASVYFDGKCISHGVRFADGTGKSVGVILPAALTFNTAAPEVMEGVSGAARVRMKGETEWKTYAAGESFNVPANSSFDIEVAGEPFHYICHYG